MLGNLQPIPVLCQSIPPCHFRSSKLMRPAKPIRSSRLMRPSRLEKFQTKFQEQKKCVPNAEQKQPINARCVSERGTAVRPVRKRHGTMDTRRCAVGESNEHHCGVLCSKSLWLHCSLNRPSRCPALPVCPPHSGPSVGRPGL